MWIRDGKISDPGPRMEKSRIRDPESRKTSRIRNTGEISSGICSLVKCSVLLLVMVSSLSESTSRSISSPKFSMWTLQLESQSTYKGRREICSLSWSVHENFASDGRPPTLTSLGWFYHHDEMYARKWLVINGYLPSSHSLSSLCGFAIDIIYQRMGRGMGTKPQQQKKSFLYLFLFCG